MGFDAIWISPIVDNMEKGYHGYWAKNWERVNSNFGTREDLKNLVDAAHERDIYVMLDVVANHVAPIENDDWSQMNPFTEEQHYHEKCDIKQDSDQYEIEHCRLMLLPDLNTENPFVRQYLMNWVHDIVEEFGFDGLRIDTLPYVPKDFWVEYAEAAGVF